MPTVGSPVQAADFTAAAANWESTAQGSVGTTFGSGSPEVSTTFTAPTSGKALVAMSAEIETSGSNVGIWVLQVYETDTGGSLIIDGETNGRYGLVIMSDSGLVQIVSRIIILEGLTPGQLYFCRGRQRASGGTVTLWQRGVAVVPLPA